jgi:hypothetical protein
MRVVAFSIVTLLMFLPTSALSQSEPCAQAAQGVARHLESALRSSVPETWGRRSAVAVRVVSACPEAQQNAFTDALVTWVNTVTHETASVIREGNDLVSLSQSAHTLGTPRLLRAELLCEAQTLRASASLYVVDGGPWQTFLAPTTPREPNAVATAHHDVALTTATATRWPSGQRPRTIATPFHGIAALAAGDLDGAPRDELVIVTDNRVRVARFTGASLTFVRDAAGGSVVRSAVPLRQALGNAQYNAANHTVRARSSSHTFMSETTVSNDMAQVRSLAVDLYPAQGIGCIALRPGTDNVLGTVATCDNTAPTSFVENVAAFPTALTVATTHWEVRANGAGVAEVRRDRTVVATVRDVAWPFVLSDINGDSTVELIAASANPPETTDRIRIFVLGDSLEERPGINVPGSIEAMTIGDLDGDTHNELVVSVRDPVRRTSTLWMIP